MTERTKTILVVCPDAMLISTLIYALDDLKDIEVFKEFSFADGLRTLEGREPDLVILQTDCRDEGMGLSLIAKAEELKIPCLAVVCHCFRPALQNTQKRIVLQWLQCGLIGRMKAEVSKFLAV